MATEQELAHAVATLLDATKNSKEGTIGDVVRRALGHGTLDAPMCGILWTQADLELVAEDYPTILLTKESSVGIMAGISAKHDGNYGVTWDQFQTAFEDKL